MRFYITLYITKLAHYIFRLLGRSGFTWPGHIALYLYPKILNHSKLLPSKGFVLISGTNGKTTTAKLTTHLLESNGLTVVTNTTGANLSNGIVSALLLKTNLFGMLNADVGVFEVDEFLLNSLLSQLSPKVLCLLNLSRDQLDRYGEPDIVFERWSAAVSTLPSSTKLFIDEQSTNLMPLVPLFSGESLFFDVSDVHLKKTNLRGKFNAKNVNVSVSIANIFDVSEAAIDAGLRSFKSAYGRGESIVFGGKNFHLYLTKNPASAMHNLDLLDIAEFPPKRTALLFMLNDKIPDGRDVSWIYDIFADSLKNRIHPYASVGHVFVGGTRFLDMSVRFHYAGLTFAKKEGSRNLSSNNNAFLIKQLTNLVGIQDVLVFPNYSAMLDMRKALTGRKIL